MTLFVIMQMTAKVDWDEVFREKVPPPPARRP